MQSRRREIEFRDRKDAGEQLGRFLMSKYGHLNPLILGVPRGGAEIAYYVGSFLRSEVSIVISKKLPMPGHKEMGFGAVAEDLSVYISPKFSSLLEPEIICKIIDDQTDEVNRRVQLYRNASPLPDMSGRTVILVDDGIATGVTLVPLLRLCRKHDAAKVIIAVPVCGKNYDSHLNDADAFEVLIKPDSFYAVGQVYALFGDLNDEELFNILDKIDDLNTDIKTRNQALEGQNTLA